MRSRTARRSATAASMPAAGMCECRAGTLIGAAGIAVQIGHGNEPACHVVCAASGARRSADTMVADRVSGQDHLQRLAAH